MVVPKIAGQYVIKRIYDQVLAPPPERQDDAADPEPQRRVVEELVVDELDGQVVLDDVGQPVGIARRLATIGVYVVSKRRGDAESELLRALNEPNSQLLIRSDDGRVTGLIYVPDPDSAPPGVEGIRSDDI
jgi:hypothetical protein